MLVLGPRIAIRPNDPDRWPLDEHLAREILARVPGSESEDGHSPASLRHAAESYLHFSKERETLELDVQEFYGRDALTTTTFHRNLAELPFRLCIIASPDSLMLRAFEEAGKSPQRGYYSVRPASIPRLVSPTFDKPLVYYLFGHYEDSRSLVLTEGDLIKFLVAVVRKDPPVPDQVRSLLNAPEASFLFLGFGFHNWYLRVLLEVLEYIQAQQHCLRRQPFLRESRA
ncbi:MAG: SIR2 family protein [Burkholderiales bacterium]